MKVKVCGLNDPGNIDGIENLNLDFLGFIFSKDSVRCIDNSIELRSHVKNCEKPTVGVFVNESIDEIKAAVVDYELDYVQLHGDQDEAVSRELARHAKVINVFKLDESFDFHSTERFESSSLFLFDTKGKSPGGNGTKFSWELLNNYQGSVDFLLAGGIRLSDVDELLKLRHERLVGVDVNSGFELSPGIKNQEIVSVFVEELKRRNYEN